MSTTTARTDRPALTAVPDRDTGPKRDADDADQEAWGQMLDGIDAALAVPGLSAETHRDMMRLRELVALHNNLRPLRPLRPVGVEG